MRSILAFATAAMLVFPEMALSAGSMGVDVVGTGHVTVGSQADRARTEEERLSYDLDSDEVQTQSPPQFEGPDIRFH
jgi:hypothetical protein